MGHIDPICAMHASCYFKLEGLSSVVGVCFSGGRGGGRGVDMHLYLRCWHTLQVQVSCVSTAGGAEIICVHIPVPRDDKGPYSTITAVPQMLTYTSQNLKISVPPNLHAKHGFAISTYRCVTSRRDLWLFVCPGALSTDNDIDNYGISDNKTRWIIHDYTVYTIWVKRLVTFQVHTDLSKSPYYMVFGSHSSPPSPPWLRPWVSSISSSETFGPEDPSLAFLYYCT